MSNYTIDLATLHSDPSFKLFDFRYDFYDDNIYLKENFEQMFIDHYLFHEIGFDSVARFKHQLKSFLRIKMPYYKQLYATELRCKDIDFMLNKDYTETYVKNISNNYTDNTDSILNGTNNNTYSQNLNETNINNSKTSALDNGIANVELSNGNLTEANASNNNITNNTSGNNNTTSNNSGNTKTTKEEINKEDYTLIGKGNIGTTSSAELLEKWRQVLINLNQIIIEDASDLFMKIY